MSKQARLPTSWIETSVAEIAKSIQYGHTASATDDSTGPRFLRITDIQDGQVDWNAVPSCDIATKEIDKYRLKSGDIVFARTGATTGKSYLIRNCPDAVFASYLIRLRMHDDIIPTYVQAFFQTSDYWRQIEGGKRGIGQPNVNASVLGTIKLPIAPLKEQRRLVAKIEELFSDLDAGVAALKRAKANLKRYRTSVLKAAIEGKLTEEWRVKHPAKEPASTLLAHILKERRQKWEADQLAKFASAKKEPPKNWREKYVEPTPPDTTGLPELPDGWCWASVDQLPSEDRHSLAIGPFGSNLKVPDYRESGVPLIFVRNIRSGIFGGDGTKFVTAAKAMELNAHSAEAGDILITKMGEPPGDACLYPQGSPKAIITADCIKVRLHPLLPDARLVVFAINSDTVRKQVVDITKGVAQQKVSLERFSTIAIPLSPLNEQQEIINEVEETLSLITVAERQIETNILRANRLRQSILKQAFEGKLVPQDPKDEPASVLLARMRASRAHDEANGTDATSKRTRAKIKESSGKPRTRIRRGPSSQNQQEE
ncbi:MAG: restriction endonuclease subunit S [Planctomycetota bacterium]|nr:restriction endonuclease subunit S [Planctomycetota bacterium]